MRLVIIRHGQSGNNLLWSQGADMAERDPDPVLTGLGHDQAAAMAAYVAGDDFPWKVTDVHCSLMMRAVETAAPLADALDQPLLGNADIFELGGPFSHDPATDVRTATPGAGADRLRGTSARLRLPEASGPDGWWPGPTEVEPAWHERAGRAIAALRAQHGDDAVVALVSHAAFINVLLRTVLGIADTIGWFVIHNTAITLLEDRVWEERPAVLVHQLNWTPHLTPGQVSQ